MASDSSAHGGRDRRFPFSFLSKRNILRKKVNPGGWGAGGATMKAFTMEKLGSLMQVQVLESSPEHPA